MKSILILVFLLFSFISFGQNYNKLIEKGKYSKVYKKCNKGLSKHPKDVLLNYYKATIQAKKVSKSLFNPKEAYKLCLKTSADFLNETDFKKLEAFSKIPLSNSSFINLIDTISRNALDDAIRSNSIDDYDAYINYYGEAPQIYIDKAVLKRNIVAFDEAKKKNTVKDYQYFIDTYPKAVQYNKAIEFRNQVAFNDAKEENTIEAYEYFMNTYPDAVEVKQAFEFRNDLAFTKAEQENTSEAYYYFISNYPEAVQYGRAFDLFELRQYEENVIKGDWYSYAMFTENFNDNSWGTDAQDNIYSIGINKKDIEALKYCADNFNSNNNYNSFLISYHFWATLDGEKESIDRFHKHYYLPEYKIKDYELIERTEQLNLDNSFDSSMETIYAQFINDYAPRDIAFIVLQRKVSPLIKNKVWHDAIIELENFLPKFSKNDKGLLNLLKVLKEKIDSEIIVKSLSKKVNSKIGKEYSPIISADDKNIYFCGKERKDNKGGEDVYVTKRNGKGWNTPKVINALSQEDKNDAPLAISADGNQIILFEDGDLFISKKDKLGWGAPEPISNSINTNFWEGDVSLSSDGQKMLFVRSYNIDSDVSIKNVAKADKFNYLEYNDASSLVKKELLGTGVNASNISYSGNNSTRAVFNGGNSIGFHLDEGIILCTGDALKLHAWNHDNGTSDNVGGDGDKDLDNLLKEDGLKTFDESVLEFDFNPTSNVIQFEYIFGSEEYPEYVGSQYNDIFAFLVSGPKPGGGYYDKINLARVPGSNEIITINTINHNLNENLFIENPINANKIQLTIDGFTTVLTAKIDVIPNTKYHIKIAIADVSDHDFDAYVFLKKNSFSSPELSVKNMNMPLVHGDRQINGDIYISNKNQDGSWDDPMLISDSINTPYSERTPFLHPDLKTLYFSSDGHGSLGKLDVYKSTRLSDSCWNCWSTPVNMGKEINTIESDWGYKISTDGKTAYFAKTIGDSDNQDIFTLKIPKHLRPDMVAQISGKIVDSEDNGIETDLRWEDLATGEIIGEAKSDPFDGSYFIVLPLGKNYGYFVDNEDYFPLSNNLNLTEMESAIKLSNDVKILSIDEMIKEGTPVTMNNLFFDFAKSNLLKESIPELKRVAKIIKDKNLQIELSGHTDNIGNDKENQKLSEARAKSARDYLISIGCKAENITAVGYGSKNPVETNSTEKGRAKNRRVEIKITGIN